MDNKKIFSWAVLLGIMLLYLAGCWYTYDFYVDDTYISLQYAKNLANHGELTFNLGEAPVEGYTNFLLVLIEALFIKMGVQEVLNIPRLVNMAAGLVVIFLTYKFSLRILKTDDMLIKFLPAVAVATSAPIIYWTVGGLESTLFAALVLGGAYYFAKSLEEESFINYSLTEAFFILATLCRPEGLIFWGAGYVFLIINHKKYDLAARLRYFFSFVMGLAIYLGWKYYYFGDLLPMSYYSKVMPKTLWLFYGGLIRYFDFLKVNFNFLYFILFIYAAIIAVRQGKNVVLYVSALVAVFSAYLISLGPSVFMDLIFRIHIPIIPLLYLLGAYGLKKGLDAQKIKENYKQYVIVALCVLQIVGGGFKVYDVWNNDGDWGTESLSVEKAMAGYDWVPLAKWLGQRMPAQSTMAIGDIGMIGYFTDFKIIDTFSLIDKNLVKMWQQQLHNEGGTPAFTDLENRMVKYVFDQDPDLIHLRYLDFSMDQRARNYVLVETISPEIFGGLFVRKDLSDRFKLVNLNGKAVSLDMFKRQ